MILYGIVLVLLPADNRGVAQTVVVEFPEVRYNPDQQKRHHIVADGIPSRPTETLRFGLALQIPNAARHLQESTTLPLF